MYKLRCVSEACALSHCARFLLINFTCDYNFIIVTLSHESMKQENKIRVPVYDKQIKKMKVRELKQQPQNYSI